ncbi:MAG: hypothetical protein QMB24_06975 [Spirosomataceae bacterium]
MPSTTEIKMTPSEINKSIEKRRISLTKGEKLQYWLNFILLSFPIILIGLPTFEKDIQNEGFSFFALILIGLIALLVQHKLTSTKLDAYELALEG